MVLVPIGESVLLAEKIQRFYSPEAIDTFPEASQGLITFSEISKVSSTTAATQRFPQPSPLVRLWGPTFIWRNLNTCHKLPRCRILWPLVERVEHFHI